MVHDVLLASMEAARDAAIEAAGDASEVGAHRSAHEAEDGLATHLFECELPGYRGWVWEVAVVRPPAAAEATICEAHLVPADDALLAPPWVPYEERVLPGDLEPGMTLPLIPEDPRLVPGLSVTDDEDSDAIALWELGLGRERVLSPTGRDEAAERWHRGSHGPATAAAKAATASCATCGFLAPLAGSLRGLFGACTNEWSASDGHVVSMDHGCGAHSQTDVEKQGARWPADEPVIDTMDIDRIDLAAEDAPEVATDAVESPEIAGDAPEEQAEDAAAETADMTPDDAPQDTIIETAEVTSEDADSTDQPVDDPAK